MALLEKVIGKVREERRERNEQRHERCRRREQHRDEDDLRRNRDVVPDLEGTAVRGGVEDDRQPQEQRVEALVVGKDRAQQRDGAEQQCSGDAGMQALARGHRLRLTGARSGDKSLEVHV
jgi:hypothetical protein